MLRSVKQSAVVMTVLQLRTIRIQFRLLLAFLYARKVTFKMEIFVILCSFVTPLAVAVRLQIRMMPTLAALVRLH